jgi:hypothetical protein
LVHRKDDYAANVSKPEVREWVVDRSFNRRSAWLQLVTAFVTPRGIVFFGIIVALAVGAGIAGHPTALIFPLVFIVVIALVSGLALIIGIRSASRILPAGSIIAAELTESSLITTLNAQKVDIPYSSMSKATQHGDLVKIGLRSSRLVSFVLPAALFPGGELETLRSEIARTRNTPNTPIGASAAFAFEREYVTEADFTRRLATTMAVWTATRPPAIFVWVVLLVGASVLTGIAVLGTALVIVGADIDSGPIASIAVTAAIFLGLIVAFCGLIRVFLGRRLRKVIPVGTRYGMTIGESTIAAQVPANSAEVELSQFRRVRTRGRFVFLVPRPGVTLLVLPIELFHGDDLARLTAAVESH